MSSANGDELEKQQSESGAQSGSSSESPEPDNRDGEALEAPASTATTTPAPPSQWQAIWAPQYNAYYFYNSETQETTWTNPLQPDESSSSSSVSADRVPATESGIVDESAEAGSNSGLTYSAASSSQYAALQAAAVAQGIDPGLAHLDPSLKASLQGTSSLPGDVPTFTAQFNAHTGRFTAPSSRTPSHLSEYERMKRMSEFYFDVNKWEEDLAKDQEGEASGKKRKRPTKKDLERFKEQKRLKKIAKTAWLRT